MTHMCAKRATHIESNTRRQQHIELSICVALFVCASLCVLLSCFLYVSNTRRQQHIERATHMERNKDREQHRERATHIYVTWLFAMSCHIYVTYVTCMSRHIHVTYMSRVMSHTCHVTYMFLYMWHDSLPRHDAYMSHTCLLYMWHLRVTWLCDMTQFHTLVYTHKLLGGIMDVQEGARNRLTHT